MESIEIDETYSDFEDYWNALTSLPTSGTSLYLNALDQDARQRFKDELEPLMPAQPNGGIKVISGSWIVRGKVPA